MLLQVIYPLCDFYPPEEIARVVDAYQFAAYFHLGQNRVSGEPFIMHPLNVARILCHFNRDLTSIIPALLHDVAEDTEGNLDEIEAHFGKDIAEIVDGVTKVKSFQDKQNFREQEKMTKVKMFLAMAKDIRVVIVKLADRLHNMQTLESLSEHTQMEKAKETLQLYAPLANQLGIYWIRWQLEDLAFKFLYPQDYKTIKEKVASKRDIREQTTRKYIKILEERFRERNIHADVKGREKHFYSIWRKMNSKFKSFDEIYDLLGLRVITHSPDEVYFALGAVHDLWTPVPGRVKDFVAIPLSNGYRSLHTTVHAGTDFLEIQIRDRKMDYTDEFGCINNLPAKDASGFAVAHLAYKEGISQKEWKPWQKNLLELGKNIQDGLVSLSEAHYEFGLEEVFVYTPKGEVKHPPKGSTTIDFAYCIHTEVGHHYSGAKVNGKIVPIEYVLQSGDTVEILVNKNSAGPSLDWLKFARSSSARAKIRKFFREKGSQELLEKGKEILRKASKKLHKSMDEILSAEAFAQMVSRDNPLQGKDLLMRLGEGEFGPEDIVALFQEEKPDEPLVLPTGKKIHGFGSTVRVNGESGIDVRIAKCCSPLPGEEIVGILSPRGITVHHVNCPHVKKIEQGQLVSVAWGEEDTQSYLAHFLVETAEKGEKVLKNIVNYAKERNLGIDEIATKFNRWEESVYRISLKVTSEKQLQNVLEAIRKMQGIVSVARVRGKK
ncbi:MAG TPA: RelA/SpoT family protein [Thermotogota bacterium]|nr:RelA/SpoT family protein [Thermotogota bacterium]HRW91805.1 RelA/SpoT family protein [Thermotogota bacterium]